MVQWFAGCPMFRGQPEVLLREISALNFHNCGVFFFLLLLKQIHINENLYFTKCDQKSNKVKLLPYGS